MTSTDGHKKIYIVMEDLTEDGRGPMRDVAAFTDKAEADAVISSLGVYGATREFELYDSADAYRQHKLQKNIDKGWDSMPTDAKKAILSVLTPEQRQKLGL